MLHSISILDESSLAEDEARDEFSFLVSYGFYGKKIELLVNGRPTGIKTTKGELVDVSDFIEVTLNIPEEHINNFPEEFDEESIRILSQLNWCKRGGKWVTCQGPC
jgi:hypothetical protein